MKLLIAGGGTGGHLFPALAIAEAVKAEEPGSEILFVGTRRGIEARIIPDSGYPIRFITARGMRRTGLFNTVAALWELPKGLLESVTILREFRPDYVLGVGGYASGPTVAAAVLTGVSTGIQEQNSVMGTTNRILSTFVGRVYVGWEDTVPPPPSKKTLFTGNPVRADLLAAQQAVEEHETFNLLVFGGSRGARSINISMIENLDALRALGPRVRVLHQTGVDEVEAVKAAYDQAGICSDVREFIHDMKSAYLWADLVVCRSGAATLAELTALGKPAIVVPYPYAIGDHQTRNAMVLERAHAVRVVPDSSLKNGALVEEIVDVAENPSILSTMARNALRLGRPEAARTIARDILSGGRGTR
ncbi:MAG: undecaprenyldiphospho-muramoylpentapeptide beta-N-acetylglucosaminyltransferase [Thermodesulfobacteriota bacterium]